MSTTPCECFSELEMPHPKFNGQRRVKCAACGYDSHWCAMTYNADTTMAYNGGGFLKERHEPEESDLSLYADELEDGQTVRVTYCCDAPASADLRRRKSPPLRTCPGCGAKEERSGPAGILTNLAPYSGLCIGCLGKQVSSGKS